MPVGIATPPVDGTAAPAQCWPASIGGSTGPTFTASSGSAPFASSQRPSHPVGCGVPGDAVCQIDIDLKWLRSGFGLADPAHDRQLPGVVQLLEAGHRRIETETVGERQHLGLVVGKLRTTRVVGLVGVRDHRAEAVVAAVQRDEDDDLRSDLKRRALARNHQLAQCDAARAYGQRGTADDTARDQELARRDMVRGIAISLVHDVFGRTERERH